MEYEHRAKMVAECLQSYRRDESGWKVCKKSVIMAPDSILPSRAPYKTLTVLRCLLVAVGGRVRECVHHIPQ